MLHILNYTCAGIGKEWYDLKFTKMHGLGNDYVYMDCTKEEPEDLSALAVRVSNRHFGVGSDGLICICPSETADFRMRMFNKDGSEGKMCGNGIRCVGKYVYDKGLTTKTDLTIETLSGIKQLSLAVEDGTVRMVTVDMGIPKVEQPLTLDIGGKCCVGLPVSMGNPHCVVEVAEPLDINISELGPEFEHCSYFKDGVNTEFITVVTPEFIRMRVWERGSGETMACGTGACAVAAAMYTIGKCKPEVTVNLLGGDLFLRWDLESGHMFMTGPAETVFEGELV